MHRPRTYVLGYDCSALRLQARNSREHGKRLSARFSDATEMSKQKLRVLRVSVVNTDLTAITISNE